MAEHKQPWGERTLEVTPQDPWAQPPPTPHAPASGPPAPPAPAGQPGPGSSHAFSRGVAHVTPAMPRTEAFAAHEPTGTGWPDAEPQRPRPSLGQQVRLLRRGGEWSSAAVLFAFVCWGVWVISSDGEFLTPVLVFAVTLVVAAGLFALSRLVGRVVLERQFGRVRRTARGSHLVVAVFLVGVGLAHLRQVEWVMTAWGWITGSL